jgi:retron-type reverse transcriptase
MKRYKHLFEYICSLENLHLAYLKARRGKQDRPAVERFTFHLEGNLLRLRDELVGAGVSAGPSYVPGPYRQFTVYESKRRLISAAPFRDRVVHHAICNVIEPIFDATFIYDSYACRVGKGQHAALRRLQEFLRHNRYALKGDVARFFPSIDHEILLKLLARKIGDEKLLHLLAVIITHSPEEIREGEAPTGWQRRTAPTVGFGRSLTFPFPPISTETLLRPHGLPIGNQTSQFFANVYLNPFDHFIKETLREKYYLRYVDDFVVLSNDKAHLHKVKEEAREFLMELRLRLHENKTQVFPATQGTDWLGYRVLPTHVRVRKSNVHRFKRRLKRMQEAYAQGEMTLSEVRERLCSWLAHAAHADSYRLRQQLMVQAVFVQREII